MAFDVEWLGLIAGVISTSAALPQLIKIIRTRSAGDVSLAMFVLGLIGTVLWGAYGVVKPAPSIIFWNVIGGIQFGAIITMKLLSDRANQRQSSSST